jgi:hypothetical protein
MQLVSDFLQAGLGAFRHDVVQNRDMLRLQRRRPVASVDGSVPSSGCFVAMACSFHIEIACHSYVIDFVYTLLVFMLFCTWD